VPASSPSVDRRAQIRERHHRAIIDAAAALLDAKGVAGFTVDELADRADVSRRTVFNHFASVDDIVIAVCSEVLGDVVERIESEASPPATAARPSVFDEVAQVLRSTDLVTPIAYLTRVLCTPDDEPSERQALVLLRAFTEVSERLSAEMLRRHPDADVLTSRLLVSSLMGGLVVLHTHWLAATGGTDDPQSRVVWDDLLERLIELTRVGYGDAAATGAKGADGSA
jgi:AcrR family transcriptional regulator